MRSGANRLGALKKYALLSLIGFPCLCIHTWCLWWFVNGTNVACLFDLLVCYVYVLCFVRFAKKVTEVTKTSKTRFKCPFANEHLTRLWTIQLCLWSVKLLKQKKTTNITINHIMPITIVHRSTHRAAVTLAMHPRF